MDRLYWQKTSGVGELRKPAYANDAGYDMVVSELRVLTPRHEANPPVDVPCGIRIDMPPGVAALVIGRSSAVKQGIIVVPTLIDQGYNGDMFIFAYNMTEDPITLEPGDRIAQLVPFPYAAFMIDLECTEELPRSKASERGTRAFGSTGGTGYGQ